MIQVKEFLDSNHISAEKRANEFLAKLREEQVVDIKYCTGLQQYHDTAEQRSYILVVYKTDSGNVGIHEP
ncbi:MULTISPECIES: sporulation protein Cse60 [Paenibacillus]|jgi:hypothetical protein|uniref:Sporulation protein Cse60 n=1 Tax=Paenibacillus oceani TaxID=2772510 RepID=A0A927H2V5_9BACL|nr:sporulation protein Cse60 [Paenibacillus oceani]MBD2866225.1 sporulation protein Cse60 [Paenibacillus oceani]